MLPKLFHPLPHLVWCDSSHRTIPWVKARHEARHPDNCRQTIVQEDMEDAITDRYHTASILFRLLDECRQILRGFSHPRLWIHLGILWVHLRGAARHCCKCVLTQRGVGSKDIYALASARCNPSTVSRLIFCGERTQTIRYNAQNAQHCPPSLSLYRCY
jgi:hypothetical protein